MRRMTGLRYALVACGSLLPALPLPAFAQQYSSADGGPDVLEEVVVTGSRIKRQNQFSSSPISGVSRDVLELSGQPTLEQALSQMPQVQPDFGRTANNPGNGTARLNLRGLGSERTLVMLNGRRLAPSGVSSSVDINNLPQALIERVEIITGGASTVYGSDAVAGVANFKTRDRFSGLSLEASAYSTEAGDSGVTDFNVLFGSDLAEGRGNIRVFAGALDRDATLAGDRAFTAVSLEDDYQGNLLPGGSFTIPAGVVFAPMIDLGNGPTFIRFDSSGDPVPVVVPDDLYNFAPVNYLQTPLRRFSAGLLLDFDITENIGTYVELTYANNTARQNLAPVPANGFFVINTDNPVPSGTTQQIIANQFFPAGPNLAGFGFSRRLVEIGPRITESDREYSRIAAGVRGEVNDRWDFDFWVTYADADEEELLFNDASAARIQQGLLVNPATGECFDPSNGCIPLDLFGQGSLSTAGADFVRLPPLRNTTSRRQSGINGVITGSPIDTWAGPLETAFGVEWRKDEGRYVADDVLFTGDGLGYRGRSGIDGSEEVIEFFGEAVIPLAVGANLAEYLGLELGARYSKYNNAGEVDSYKVGATWSPVEGLHFRSMYQRSVRAPNLEEAFEESFRESGVFVATRPDPCSASSDPVAAGFVEKCVLQGIPADQIGVFEAQPFPADFVLGGNPALVPETADTFTAGFVLNFGSTGAWQLAVDYFDMKIADTIGSIDPARICFDPANTSNLFCENLRRDSLTFNVAEVLQPTSNRGESTVRGFDTQFSFGAELPGWMAATDGTANLDIEVVWTYLDKKTVQDNPVATIFDCAGKFGEPCNTEISGETFPRNRITTHATYSSGQLGVNITWRWIDGTNNAAPFLFETLNITDPVLQIPDVGSKSYVDLGLAYDITERVSARLNILNLGDTDPPLMADAVFANNTDASMFDIFGRAYQLTFTLNY